MTCRTPCSLRMQAADCYLKTISNSNVFKCIHTYATKMFTNCNETATSRERMEEIVMHLAVSATVNVSKKLDGLMKHLTKALQPSPDAQRLLKWRVNVRSVRIDSPATDLLLQLLFCESVSLQAEHEKYLILMSMIGKQFSNILALTTNKFVLIPDTVHACLLLFPELVVINAYLLLTMPTLQELRDNGSRRMLKLRFGFFSTYKDLTNDDYCRIFFNGTSLEDVESCFTLGQQVSVTFPTLVLLSLPLPMPDFLSFFKMFLHFYPRCHVDWLPQELDLVKVSTFDAALCHTIDLNPTHRLRHCELRYEDLRFPYVDEVLSKWLRLDTIAFIYSYTSTTINHDLAREKLQSIFRDCKRLKNFHMVVVSTNVEKCFQTTLSSLEKYGDKMEKLSIVDMNHSLSHRQLVDCINTCPNVVSLELNCKPTSKYSKDSKVRTLHNLQALKLIFLTCHLVTKSKVSAMFICDLLKASPNLKSLKVPIDDYFISEMHSLKFPPSLVVLTAFFYNVSESKSLQKPLLKIIRKMALKELVVDSVEDFRLNLRFQSLQDYDNIVHVRMRHMVRNSELQDDLMKYLTKELQQSPDALKSLKQRVNTRALRVDSPPSDLLLQLFFCSSITVQDKHEQYIVLLGVLTKKFNNIRVLTSNKLIMSTDLLHDCLLMFPKVVVINAFVLLTMNTLRVIRDYAPRIEELLLGFGSNYKEFTNDDLCRIFFAGLSLEKVEGSFTSGTLVQISFPKLRVLEFPLSLPKYFSFFKMFLHFYPTCHVDWIPQQYETILSTFDAALCHTIDLNPAHRLRHCELRYEDLRFPYVDEVLVKWTRLETMAFIFGLSSANIDHDLAQQKLDSILSGCPKLINFHMMVVSSSVDKCFQTTLRSLEKHGHRFETLFILDLHQTLSHKQLVDCINSCPNVSTIEFHCKPSSRYPKDAKIKTLKNLLHMRLRFLPCHSVSKSKNSALFFSDILRASPNITNIDSPIDHYFLTELCKLKYSSKLKVFTAYFYILEDTASLLKPLLSFIKKLPIKELIADCLETHKEVHFEQWPHVLLRNMIRNTELVVRCFDIKVSWQGV